MADYIKRSDAFKTLAKYYHLKTNIQLFALSEGLERVPDADAVEVKRGKWIKDRLVSTGGGTYGVYRCSRCEAYYQDVGYGFNYCPNCGANMKGEQDG